MRLVKILYIFLLFSISSCSSSNDDIEASNDQNQEQENDQSGGDDNSGDNGSGTGGENETGITIVDGIKIGPNYVVFEPEVTKSNLGAWVVRKKGEPNYFPESSHFITTNGEIPAFNDAYLEFTGNNLNGGQANSPLKYTFKAPKAAKFRIAMRMLQPLEPCTIGTTNCADNGYEKGDKRNDLWIKLEGDYTTACVYSTEDLKKDHKFWGRGVRKWGSTHSLEGHVNGNRTLAKVVYNLKKDEEYTLTISGRAQGCSIDYIVFYEESLEQTENFEVINHTDVAKSPVPDYLRPEVAQ